MQKQSYVVYVWISIEVINSRRVKRTGAADYPVNFVAFLQQQICQLTSVLPSDAGDQCPFHLGNYCRASVSDAFFNVLQWRFTEAAYNDLIGHTFCFKARRCV